MCTHALRRLSTLALLVLVALLLAGCNTMEGLGKDIQKAGQAVEKSAEQED